MMRGQNTEEGHMNHERGHEAYYSPSVHSAVDFSLFLPDTCMKMWFIMKV